MKDEYTYLLQELSNSVHEYVNNCTQIEELSMFKKSDLAEAYISIESLLENESIEAHERVILNRDLHKIYDKVYNEESLYYYSSFYYAYGIVKKGDINEIQNQIKKINIDIMAMILNIKSIVKGETDLSSSTDNYFFSRMERCTWAFKKIIIDDMEEFFVPALYCIGNMMQALYLYYSSGKNKYKDRIDNLMNLLNVELQRYIDNKKVMNLIEDNYALKYFLQNQVKNYFNKVDYEDKLYINININNIKNERIRESLRISTSLYNIDIEKFKEYFEAKFEEWYEKEESMTILEKILFLRVLSKYINCNKVEGGLIELGLYEDISKVNIEDFINQVFKFNEIDSDNIKQETITKLHNMKDDELRYKFSNTIQGVNTEVLRRESSKPHGSFEISDMEIPVRYRGKRYYLCMPFKSGAEIKKNTVPVDVAYQIVRPFIEFKNCVVIFVTAKKCSENLMNYIKKLQDSLGWPIGVIEEKSLAALLIMNNQL